MKVALCHGVIDVLHVGHVRYLQAARELSDFLVVTITADAFVNKGAGRPLFNEHIRREMLMSLRCVDHCDILHEATAISGIEKWRPDLYCKGAEYAHTDKAGNLELERAAVKKHGGKLIIIPAEITFSSTKISNGEMLKERIRECRKSIRRR